MSVITGSNFSWPFYNCKRNYKWLNNVSLIAADFRGIKHYIGKWSPSGCDHITPLFILNCEMSRVRFSFLKNILYSWSWMHVSGCNWDFSSAKHDIEGVWEKCLSEKDMARQWSRGNRLAWLCTRRWMTECAREGYYLRSHMLLWIIPSFVAETMTAAGRRLKTVRTGLKRKHTALGHTTLFQKSVLISVKERGGHYRQWVLTLSCSSDDAEYGIKHRCVLL